MVARGEQLAALPTEAATTVHTNFSHRKVMSALAVALNTQNLRGHADAFTDMTLESDALPN